MTQERIKEAVTAWQKISDACASSCNIEWILNNSKDAHNFYNFEIKRTDWGETYWVNVDEIICAEVYRKHGDKEWRVSPHIEIVDPITNDWDGVNYNVNEL